MICVMLRQRCRRWGCKRTTKGFDLSKIRAKSLKILAKSLKIWAKMVPNVVSYQKMAPNVCRKTHEDHLRCFISKNGAQRLQKNTWRPFFWRSYQKRSSGSLWEKICKQKLHKNFSGKFGKNPSYTQKFVGSYTYVAKRSVHDGSRKIWKILFVSLLSDFLLLFWFGINFNVANFCRILWNWSRVQILLFVIINIFVVFANCMCCLVGALKSV